MQTFNEQELAYFAGILDGDGSFSLCRKIENVNRSPLYYPLVQLSSTYFDIIERFHNRFGGYVTERKAYCDKRGINHKASRHWKLEKTPKCLPFLQSISLFLVSKKPQAELLIYYIETNEWCRGNKRLEDAVLRQRESIYIKMHQLNTEKHNTITLPKKHIDCHEPIAWWYIAGLMDTDGSFSLKKQKNGPYYSPVISISMIDSKAISFIYKHFSRGNICTINAKTSRTGSSYRFIVTGLQNCLDFLHNVVGPMKLKYQQAKLLMDFCQLRLRKSLNDQECEEYYQQIVNANKNISK